MEIRSLRFKQIIVWHSGGEIELTNTKSGDRETVPLNRKTVELLFTIARERGIDLYDLTEKNGSQHDFLNKHGRKISDLRYVMKQTFKKAGIPYRPFHTFRHFWSSEMFDSGADVAKLKKIGRWGDLKTMLRYCHSYRADDQDAIDAFSEHLDKKPGRILKLQEEIK